MTSPSPTPPQRYTIDIRRAAVKAIRKIPANLRKHVIDRIETLAENPRPYGAIELEGEPGTWRVRQGGYRILYEIQDDRLIVVVVKVSPRGGAYQQ